MPIVAEDNMVKEFKRRAHHYLSDLPKDGDNLEWLALMQHHGAATRLLDWTRSPYVAAFFAAEKATPLRPFAVWAINYRVVNTTVLEMMGLESSRWDPDLHSDVNFDAISSFPQPEGLYVAMAVAPFRMNQRLTIQQGLFLCANKTLIGLPRCLMRVLYVAREHNPSLEGLFHKLVVQPGARSDVLSHLLQMNITAATLFPGLDGFARSLSTQAGIQYPRFHRLVPG